MHHPHVGTEHLLLGVLADDASPAALVLHDAGVRLSAARHKVVEAAGTDPDETTPADPELTPRAQRALERAGRFSRQDREQEVRGEHVLLGILDVEGLACQVLRGLGVDVGRLRDSLVGSPPPAPTAGADARTEPPAEAPVLAPLRPRCPSCTTSLDESLTATTVAARRIAGGTTAVRIAYCGACGTALGPIPPTG
jgi:ATP-dependent Clp protease ATP-binding subunit ClpC